MSKLQSDPLRRRFMRVTVGAVIALPAMSLLTRHQALAADTPKLDPGSEKARQLSYTHLASSSENPAREEGARCANCTHFHGDAGAQWATCNIFPEHRVNADGWCSSWFSSG